MKRRRPARSPLARALLRLVAAFAAFLVAGDHGLASLHQALTPHETCAEHGELAHRGAESVRADSPSPVPAFERNTGAEGEHHHCGTVPAAPLRAPTAADQSELAFAPFGGFVPQAEGVALLCAADVLAFAPKQSPPV
jgi:hypothetical protein